MASALKLTGRQGRHAQLINGTYAPTGSTHHDRPVWVARAVQPVHIFHTGKSRWVVSKRLDDGARCYAFMEDTGQDPLKAQGNWVCCDSDNQWRADQNVHLTGSLASNDKFVQIRLSLDDDLDQYQLHKPEHLKQLWKILDVNGNNIVSLAEIDKLVVEFTKDGTWPAWLNNKPALMRAYKKTTLRDGRGDSWVHKREFSSLLLNVFWFNKLFQIFSSVADGDRRIDLGEFQCGLSQLGLQLSPAEAQAEFQTIDTNHGGQVLFVEFCAWVRNRICPDHNKNFDSDIVSGEHCGHVLRKSHGNHGTHTHFISKKNMSQFDALEVKFKAMMGDKKQLLDLWHVIDFNGNNIVSLAEIDKMVVENYPLLNHKPALMRAYKATIKAGDGDDWVQKREFKSLLGNLLYFNKLFWLFEKVDDDMDRRLTYQEFRKLLSITGALQKMSNAECQDDFRQVDKNGGGIILFNEFCQYFTAKMCPECLQAFVG